MTRTVALLGATGYTGRLTAAELAARGVPHLLAGRSRERLDALPGDAERVVVDLDRPESLDALLARADVLVTCVGPFAQHGMPAVESAVRTGTPYVDSTGETTFMREVYEQFQDAPSPIVPACGFDYVPGDLAAAIAAEELGEPVREVNAVYTMGGEGGASRGTLRSAVGMVASARLSPGYVEVRGRSAVEVPWGEAEVVPRKLPGASVRTGFAVPRRAARAIGFAALVTGPVMTGAVRLGRPLLQRLVERMPEGPDEQERRGSQAEVVVEARGATTSAAVRVQVRDPYGITARLLVAASQQVAGSGALTTAQALQPRVFLDAVSYEDERGALSWEVL